MLRAAIRFGRSFQASTPDRDARLRLAGENSLDRGTPGTNSSAPLSVHASIFHQHHVVKTFVKDHTPDPAGTPDVAPPKPASRAPKRDCLPMPPTGTNPTANQQANFESIQWSVPPNTVTAPPLSSTPVTKPPRQSHKSRSPPVIHFGDFLTNQRSPALVLVAVSVPKSTPRFSLPPRLHRRTKYPVAKVTQATQATQTKPVITIYRISTVPDLAHLALRLAKQHGLVVMIAASIRQQAAQSISRAFRFWYSRQSVARLRSASLIEQ